MMNADRLYHIPFGNFSNRFALIYANKRNKNGVLGFNANVYDTCIKLFTRTRFLSLNQYKFKIISKLFAFVRTI
jgi:hypothetical protein